LVIADAMKATAREIWSRPRSMRIHGRSRVANQASSRSSVHQIVIRMSPQGFMTSSLWPNIILQSPPIIPKIAQYRWIT